jgi:hypothetical protein
MNAKRLLKYFVMYEIAAFFVNKTTGNKLPFDLISGVLLTPAGGAPPATSATTSPTPLGAVGFRVPLGAFDPITGRYSPWAAGNDRMTRAL